MGKRGIIKVPRYVLDTVFDVPTDAMIVSCTWDAGNDQLLLHMVGSYFDECPDGVTPIATRINFVTTKNVIETEVKKFVWGNKNG